MPSILTLKFQEAQTSINNMNQNFINLNSQINKTNNEGFKPLESTLKDEADFQKNTLLNAYKDMNNLPPDE